MIKKGGAVILSLVMTALSAGPEAYLAAGEIASSRPAARSGAPALPSTRAKTGTVPALSDFRIELFRGSPSLRDLPRRTDAPRRGRVEIPLLGAVSAGRTPLRTPVQTRFRRMMGRLEAPSLLKDVPRDDRGEASKGGAREDFALRLGAKPEASAVETIPETSPPSLLSLSGGKAHGRRAGEPAPARAAAVEQPRSAFFPGVLAALAGGGALALAALQSLVLWVDPALSSQGPHAASGVLAPALGLAAAGAAWVAGGFALASLWQMGRFAVAVLKGRKVTDQQFHEFVQSRVAAGLLDPGLAERIRPAQRVWDFRFGYAAGRPIYVRPELAASPDLFDKTVIHEHHHYLENKVRGPPGPGLIGTARRLLSEIKAWASELRGSKALRKIRVPILERALQKAQLSFQRDQDYEVLVVNPASEELKDEAVYRNLFGNKVGVEVSSGAPGEYQAALGKKENFRRFRGVVLDQAHQTLPKEGTKDRLRLDLSLKQIESLFILATRRLARAESGFKPGTAHLARYRDLAAKAGGVDGTDPKEIENFERLVRDFWREIVSTRLKGLGTIGLIENLYKGLQNQGAAFLSFGPGDAGVEVWEKLLRYWEAEDGGEFRLDRWDFEDGRHILILQKLESRVGLWLRPLKGSSIKVSIPDALASGKARREARAALEAAGFKDHLKTFDELDVEVQAVFGADVARQEILVSVPRRHGARMRNIFSRAAIAVEHSETGFETHLMDAGPIHHAPRVHRIGIRGQGLMALVIDTGGDDHEDFNRRLGHVDPLHEGNEDWIGHGTHVVGILMSAHRLFKGMASALRAIVVKVFGRNSPGASDGHIEGGATIGLQRGVDGINASLGRRGSSADNLSLFLSQLTLQKNSKGEYMIVVASAGNSGPFDQTISQPAAGEHVIAVAAAAKSLDDGRPEIAFYSSVGPDVDPRLAIEWVNIKPDVTAIGGDVVTDPGDPNVYKRGVFSAKSQDMPPNPSDTPDHKHTGMSGTSMASPLLLGIALLVKQALRLVLRAFRWIWRSTVEFIMEHMPLSVKAILMRTATDLGAPVWFQGAGLADAWEAVKLVFVSAWEALSARILWVFSLGGASHMSQGPWDWINRYKAVLDLANRVRQVAEIAKSEARARFEDEAAQDPETPAEGRRRVGDAVYAEMVKKFDAAAKEALPELLKALEDEVWLVRRQAALVLLNLKRPEAGLALAQAALKDGDARVRQMAFLALAKTRTLELDVLLRQAAADPRWDVGVYAAYALARHGDSGGVVRIVQELGNPDKSARFTAAWLLGQLGDRASAAEAEALSSKVQSASERGNIRHLSAASLSNIASWAPGAVSDKVIVDLLDSAGVENLALTRTVSKFFPAALQNKEILQRLRAQPLRSVVTAFVLKNRGAVAKPGSLGELVALLARALDIPLDFPTPIPAPGGLGVPGVDPALGALDLIIEVPSGGRSLGSRRQVSGYWDSRQGGDGAEAVSETGLEPGLLSRFEARLNAALPLSGSLWVSVPEHNLRALAFQLKRRGYSVRLSLPQHSLASSAGADRVGSGLVLNVGSDAPYPVITEEDLSLVRISADRGASEARVMAALEYVYAEARDPLKAPVLLVLGLGGGSSDEKTPLGRLIDRLVLNNVGVVLPAGDDGPAEDSVSSSAGRGLAVVVAAAGKRTGLQLYSSRGSAENPAIAWADLVDELDLEALKSGQAGSYGTAAAAQRSAEKMAALARRLSQVLIEKNGRLPDGYFLYIADLIKQTLRAMPSNQAHEAGSGLFADPEDAMRLLESRLLDPAQAAREAKALIREVRRRHRPQALKASSRPKAASSSEEDERARKLKALKELRAVLSDGAIAPSGKIEPFDFEQAFGHGGKARSAGLEGLLYSKLEFEKAYGARLDKLDDYFNHIDGLFSAFDWAQPLGREFAEIRSSNLEAEKKNERLNGSLVKVVSDLQQRISDLDQATWLREAQIYMILARAYNRPKDGKNFFDSLDEEDLQRIKAETRSSAIWLLDIFEIGEIRRWGTGGGSPYSITGYEIKEELGGEAAFKRFVARAHAAGLKVGVDQIPNHVSLDSDLIKTYPEALLHIVPPQNLSDEEIMASVPRHVKGDVQSRDPVFFLIHTDRYPENGRRVSKKILVHHPLTDYGGDMWIDMAQRDFSTRIARDWETAEAVRMFREWGVDLFRRDMSYEVLNVRYFDRWPKILAAERDRSQGWAREEIARLIADFERRREALGGAEFLEEATDAVRRVNPGAAMIDEAYGHTNELGRAGSAGIYNKNDHDVKMAQIGLYDAIVSRSPARIREALRNAAFRLWQKGGSAMVNFIGTHDGGEGNPIDKFAGQFKAAALTALLFRPTLVYNGLEQGVGQRENLIADLSQSVDTQKAIPFDIPVLLNWAKADPVLQGFLRLLWGKAEEHKSLFSNGAMEVLEPQGESPIVSWTVSRKDEVGKPKALIAAANFGDGRSSAVFKMGRPVLADFGAFEPRADRTYVLRDVLSPGPDGQPAVYERSGKELIEKGLYVELDGGGVHLFEVEEVDPSAPATGPPGQVQALIAEEPGPGEVVPAAAAVLQPPTAAPVVVQESSQAAPARPSWRAKAADWLRAPWGTWVERLVYFALVPFFFLQGPQIMDNFHYLYHDPAKISILPWIGYSTGILANSNLWGYHIDGKRHAVAFVQAAGMITSSVVLAQIFWAGFMPAAAAWMMGALILASLAVNILRWTGRLPGKIFGVDPWKIWDRLSKLLGLAALPLGFSVTFGLMDAYPVAVLAVSALFAAWGAQVMILEYQGRLNRRFRLIWKTLGAVLGVLLFVFLPIPQLVNNFSHPENIAGIAVGTLLLSTLGNLMEVTGAVWHKNQIWFVGSFWAVAVGGWGVLLSLFLFGAVAPALFLAYSIIVPAYLLWVIRQANKNHPDASYWETLKFILLGDKKGSS